MQANAYGIALIPPGGINLHAYPALTHAPFQHGEGIRFAHNGTPVEDVLVANTPCHEGETLAELIDYAASSLGVSFGDVCDALKYLRDSRAI